MDLLLRGAEIIDGTGRPGYTADLGVEGDTITCLGEVRGGGRLEIDGTGLTVTPGFVDIHAHSDFTLLIDGRGMSAVTQGVTTQINGNCGISPFPVGEEGVYLGPFDSARLRGAVDPDWTSASGYFSRLEAQGTGINAAFLIGHGAVRHAVMGASTDPPSKREMDAMGALVETQMAEGALGLSTGLTYVPGSSAKTEELIELAAATAPFGGFYATHMRNYTASIMEALDEAIRIGREAGVPVQVSHITPCPPATGRADRLLARIDEARRDGVDVAAETELYATGSTSLSALLPPWALIGGNDEMVARLRQPDLRRRMWGEIEERGSELGGSTKTVLMQRGEWDRLWLGNCDINGGLIGKSFRELGELRSTHPFEAICDILVEEGGAASFYGQDKTNDDIDTLANSPFCGLGSDGLAMAADGPLAQEREHPRCYGGMAYLMQTMVRERKALSVEQAVQKVTQFPAQRMGLKDRGEVRQGLQADLVLFDPETIADRATIVEPRAYAEGIDWLFVNGEAAVSEGEITGARSGRVLKAGGSA